MQNEFFYYFFLLQHLSIHSRVLADEQSAVANKEEAQTTATETSADKYADNEHGQVKDDRAEVKPKSV